MRGAKMKKTFTSIIFIGLFVMMFVVPISCVSGNQVALALNPKDIFDEIFIQTITEMGQSSDKVDATKQTIYDLELRPLGYIYNFTSNYSFGYAIMTNQDDCVKVSEVVLDAESPYLECSGLAVYPSELNYIEYKNEKYNIVGSSIRFDYAKAAELFPVRYCGTGGSLQVKESKITFVSKSINSYSLARTVPTYTTLRLDNPCVSVASANIIAYYDRFKENLIPDYNPGKSIGRSYLYNKQNVTIDNLIEHIYNILNPNSSGQGNTISEFKQGLAYYCSEKGYSVEFEKCPTANFYNTSKNMVSNGRPIVMFTRGVEFCLITENNTEDVIRTFTGNLNHTMCGFGYKEVEYTLPNNSVNVERYILVSTGIENYPSAYLNANNNLAIDEIYGINIL